MIQGVKKTEANYREVYLDSSSSLKDFSMDKRKYYKKYILNETVEEKPNIAINTGRIVETILLEEHLFDEKFYVSTLTSAPTGLMLLFVEALYDFTKQFTNPDTGEVTKSFEFLTQLAYDKSGFKLAYETVMNKFVDSEAQQYYDEIREVRSKNLTVVSTSEIENSVKIVEELKTNFVTKDIVNLESGSRYDVLNQFQIENYEILGLKLKSMIDRVVIDHEEKTITPWDLKCTWSVDNFYKEYYLYRRSYIQAYLYYIACKSYFKEDDVLSTYKVIPTKFIVCDSINYMNPLIYQLSEHDLKDAYNGFLNNGRHYPGVKMIIEELQWSVETNIWNMLKSHHESKGVLNIKE